MTEPTPDKLTAESTAVRLYAAAIDAPAPYIIEALTGRMGKEHYQNILRGGAEHERICAERIAAAEQEAWQPIETAPRDGTDILLWTPFWEVPRTGWTCGRDPWQCAPISVADPTHWRPLPAPPAAEAGVDGGAI